jgi:hypothetical protein
MLPPDTIDSRMYVLAWIGDDPSEIDDNPLIDGGAAVAGPQPVPNPGAGVLALVAHAYGPGGTRRVIEATIARRETEVGFRILSWRERR